MEELTNRPETEATMVACLGPEGSFSHEFAIARFPGAAYLPIEGDFFDVLKKVEDGTCSVGVIPFLNSNGVHVRPAQAAIASARDWICVEGCFPHAVTHNLVVTGLFTSLQRVVSKEQVFPQCSNWLDQWSGIERCPSPSTSAALKDLLNAPAAEQQRTGAICNRLAHELYGGILKYPGIENPGNVTLFLVVSRRQPVLGGEDVLICLTCPTEACYRQAIRDFSCAGFPLKFTSLKGEFTEELPCFLQFEVRGSLDALQSLLGKEHRHLLGSFPAEHSLASCVGSFFDDSY